MLWPVGAQQPARPAKPAATTSDTSKARRDSIAAKARRDSIALKARRDSVARASAAPAAAKTAAPKPAAKSPTPAARTAKPPAPPPALPAADTLKPPADTLKPRADSAAVPGDTLRPPRDSTAKGDSSAVERTPEEQARIDSVNKENKRIIAEQRRRADSLKAPLAAVEMPVLTDIGDTYAYNREQLFAAGALTLTDFLERIPGVTTFRSGWVGAPHTASLMGDFSRIRVFFDGIELDPLDPRMGGMLDLSAIQLWDLEEMRIERGAGEIRVHLKTWRVRSTTPNTRVDIGTGDLDTNGYRGFYGKRFVHGEALQLGANQLRSQDPRGQGDSQTLTLFGRLGWAKKGFSVDGSFVRTNRDRTAQTRDEEVGRPGIPKLDARYTQAYARIAYTDTTHGFWGQLLAASIGHSQNNLKYSSTDTANKETPRLNFSRPQYVAALGWSRGPLSISSTTRLRPIDGERYIAPSARAAFDTRRLAVSFFGETQPDRELRRVEVSGRVLPLSWLAFSGTFGQFGRTGTKVPNQAGGISWRAEGAIRVKRAWFGGGLMARDSAILIAPVVYDTGFAVNKVPSLMGPFVRIRGKFWKDVGLDIVAVKWDSAGLYRPQYQTRTQLYANSAWLSRFPSGNFNILAAVTHEYRTAARFPIAGGQVLEASQYRTLDFLLEIKLLQATLTYQFRNLLAEQYDQVPGFPMHRPVQVYGVRWQFFN